MQENNLKRLVDLDGSSGTMEFDEKGYVRFIPSEDEKKKIERYLSEQIDKAITDREPEFKNAAENINTYKAAKERVDGGDEMILPLPLAAIAADQIIAATYNLIVRPKPMISFDAYFNDQYSVTVPLTVPQPQVDPLTGMPAVGPDGQPVMQDVTVAVPTPTDSEEIAANFERGLEFKARERFNFPKIARQIATDTVIVGKAYVKTCADRSTRTMFAPEISGWQVDLESAREVRIKSAEAARMYALPIFNVLYPVDVDLDESPWVAERLPIDPDTFLARCSGGKAREYYLIKEDEAESISKSTSEVRSEYERDARDTKDDNAPQKVLMMEVQLDWTVKIKDPETGEKSIKTVSFLCDWNHSAKKLCTMFRNPYDHQERLIDAYYQIEGAHDGSGTCTVGRMKWHQKVATYLVQAEIKNAFHANNFTYWWAPGSVSEEYLAGKVKLRPGEGVPGVYGEDWGVARVGEGFTYSLLPLTQWTEGSGQRTSNVSDYEQGTAPASRTPAATVSQILQQGLQQPLMYVRGLSDSFSKSIRKYLKTGRQFQPFGETIPVSDPKSQQIIEIPFRYPIAGEGVDPLDNFRISLTAADEALAKEHEPEQVLMWMNTFQQFASFIPQVAGPLIIDPNATPEMVKLGHKILAGLDSIFQRYTSIFRADEEKYSIAENLDGMVKEREAAMQQMAMAQQNGMMNANPNANPGAVPAGPGAPDESGNSGMAGEPSLPPPDSEAPPTDLPVAGI